MFRGPSGDNTVNDLVYLYHKSGQHQDIITLLDEYPYWNESNLKENRFWLNNLEYKFFHKEDMMDILDYADLVKIISLENIQRAATKYFNMNNYVRVTLFPEEWMKE